MKQKAAIFCLFIWSLSGQAAIRTESETYALVKNRVFTIIAEQTGRDVSEIKEDQNFVSDLKMDHEMHEGVREALSQELNREIPIDAAAKITTVQRAINYIFIRQQ